MIDAASSSRCSAARRRVAARGAGGAARNLYRVGLLVTGVPTGPTASVGNPFPPLFCCARLC